MDGQVHIVEDHVVAIRLFHILTNHRIVTGAHGRRELQTKRRSIFFVNFNRYDFLQLLDAALHLYSLRSLVTETFDKIFRVFYFFLLILVSTQLLFAAFLTQHDKLIVSYLVIVYPSAGNFNGAIGHVVNECPVVTYQYYRTGTHLQEILQPLDTLNIQVVGRLVEQQHIGTTQQKLR